MIKNVLKKIKNKIAYETYKLKASSDFNRGYTNFLKTGTNSPEAYKALVHLYRSTNGKWNEREQKKIASQNPPIHSTVPQSSMLGAFDEKKFRTFNDKLNTDGYAVFDKKLPENLISELYAYALTEKMSIKNHTEKITYSPEHPISEMYTLDANPLVNNPVVQSLIMDPVLIEIARNYFESEPIFDCPYMWWSTAYLKVASSGAAQLYHFDLERIKWLKLFVYLTPVTEQTGPHSYIRGSHIPGNKPAELLKRGYVRIPDADLEKYYKKEDFVEVAGDAGSMFFGDTKCWHKGKAPTTGHRLVLQLEYTSSLFGANLPRLKVSNSSSEFKDFCKENPVYASNIDLT